jgi:hypothetical protein
MKYSEKVIITAGKTLQKKRSSIKLINETTDSEGRVRSFELALLNFYFYNIKIVNETID